MSIGAQQKILIAAAVIVKLAALDEMSRTDFSGMQDGLEVEPRGICPLLNVYIQNIITNLAPIPSDSTYQVGSYFRLIFHHSKNASVF